MSIELIIIVLFLTLVIFNLFVVRGIFKRLDISKTQKSLQSLIVIVIPFIGGAIVWSFHKSEDEPLSEKTTNNSSGGLDNYTVGGG